MLTRPSRLADLVKLDLRYRRVSPEGVVFWPSNPGQESQELNSFSQLLNMRYCAQKRHYECTRGRQSLSNDKSILNEQNCTTKLSVLDIWANTTVEMATEPSENNTHAAKCGVAKVHRAM